MIYLDYAASTPLHPALSARVSEAFTSFGNSQSDQMIALQALITKSKSQIAAYIDAEPNRLFYTSGSTESISLALIGAARFYKRNGTHIVTFATEHSAVLEAVKSLHSEGFNTSILPVMPNGAIDIKILENNIRKDTVIVSVNAVCNETGCIQNLQPLFSLRDKYGFLLHIDASQIVGKIPFSVKQYPADFLTLSSHKCYGPQGIGALYIAPQRHVTPLIHGSHPIRSGTMSHALILLMGEAYALAQTSLTTDILYVEELRELLLNSLTVPFEIIESEQSVPHIVNVSFPKTDIKQITQLRQKIACQISSACFTGGVSHVLQARGVPLSKLQRSIRLSFGHMTTRQNIIDAVEIINNDLQYII